MSMLQAAGAPPGLKAALVGGLAAGALDYVAAVLASGAGFMVVGQAIASGLLGRAAFQGGVPVALLGAALHFAILLVVAAIYVAAARRMEFLWRQPLPCGVVLGLIVYSIMNAIVVPLSNAAVGVSPDVGRLLVQMVIHMTVVGPPIAFAAARIR
ncbi:MAG TPA: hypothetical protein VEA15_10970 [Caulobacteraceae bacterium]|nr:hypothetical protein [Caulobacteraceae bacterium]